MEQDSSPAAVEEVDSGIRHALQLKSYHPPRARAPNGTIERNIAASTQCGRPRLQTTQIPAPKSPDFLRIPLPLGRGG